MSDAEATHRPVRSGPAGATPITPRLDRRRYYLRALRHSTRDAASDIEISSIADTFEKNASSCLKRSSRIRVFFIAVKNNASFVHSRPSPYNKLLPFTLVHEKMMLIHAVAGRPHRSV